MHARTLSLSLVLTLSLAAGCVTPPEIKIPRPDVPDAPTPVRGERRTVAELYAHGTDQGEVELRDLAAAHGLEVKIDLVAGRRILTNATNEAIVEPGTRQVTINKVSYPLTAEVRWRDGKIYFPGDARAVFAERIRGGSIPDVADFSYLDLEIERPRAPMGPRPAGPPPRALTFDANIPPLPASWNQNANRTWSYLVIHHSATAEGSARTFDRAHAKKWTHGLGYHFVIGNGTETRDGQIEVGPRWTQQNAGIHGAHAGVDKYNQHGIGICLVGDFDPKGPSAKQLTALRELCHVLMRRYGIPRQNVLGHRDVKSGHTDCPGHRFPLDAFVRSL